MKKVLINIYNQIINKLFTINKLIEKILYVNDLKGDWLFKMV